MLQLLLRPGEAIMNRLRFSQKAALLLLLVTLPMFALSGYFIFQLTRSIQFVATEQVGIQVIRPAVEFVKQAQRHRGTAARLLAGDLSAQQNLTDFQTRADAAVAELDRLVQHYASTLNQTGAWQEIKAGWAELKSRLATMSPQESFAAHTELIGQMLEFISRTADYTNLTTDPELDSHYLLVLATDLTPSLTEFIGQERGIGSGAATRGTLQAAEAVQLQILKYRVDIALERMKTGLQQVYRANPVLRGHLEPLAAPVESQVGELQTHIGRDILAAARIELDAGEFFEDATLAIDGVYALYDQAMADLDRLLAARKARAELDRLIALVLAVGVPLVVLYLLVTFSTSATRGLRLLEQSSRRLAEGDLTQAAHQVTSRDEIGQVMLAFNQTIQQMRSVMQRVSQNSQALLEAAEELSATAEEAAQASGSAAETVTEVATGAGEQAHATHEVKQSILELQEATQQIARGANSSTAEVQRTSALLEEMVKALEAVVDSATAVAGEASRATESATRGADVVERTAAGMERIRQQVGETASRIRELEQLSSKIGEITNVISEIADQTNLLALNAAIEAARAGEHGRGFAVVADEVRRLAERSAASSRQIADLIREVQERTGDAVQAMDAGNAEVQEGARLALAAGQALKEILVNVGKAAREVQEIAEASRQVQENAHTVVGAFGNVAAVMEENTAATGQMAAGASQATEAVERISLVSQGNAASSEELSAALEELNASSEAVASSAQDLTGIAEELRQQVALFRV